MGSKNLQTVPTLPSNVELFYARHCISLLNEVKSSIVEQYRQKVHDRTTKICKFCVDVRQLPKWMMYCNHSGTSISWKLQTFGHLVDIIFCVVISSNSILSRLNPVAILTLQNSETYQLLAYPDEAPEVTQHDWGTPCYLFMWNCNNVDCKFLKEVSFELGADSSEEKIIKCGAHPIFHMKNKSTSAHKKDKKRSRLNYKLSSLSIE